MQKQQELFTNWAKQLVHLNFGVYKQRVTDMVNNHLDETQNWRPIEAFNDVLQLASFLLGESKENMLLWAKEELLKVLSIEEVQQVEALFMEDQLM